jgi:hypothetical protein
MSARAARYFTIDRPQLAGLLLLCACNGCWEKVKYTGPDPTTSTRPESPPPDVTIATPQPPVAHAGDGDGAKTATETPDNEAAIPDGLPTREPPGTDAAPAEEPTEVVGTRYAASESAVSRPEETATASNTVTPPDSSTTPTPDPPAVPDSPLPPNTRRAAWQLGSKLSIVALANDRGVTEHVPAWAKEASAAAKVLDVKLAKLPDRPENSDPNELASKQVLNYLFVQGQEIGRVLATRYGPDHAALLEVAVKSNLLILLYQPASSTADTIAGAISQAAPRAKLPDELWQPLVDSLKKQAPLADVRAAVRTLHADVDQYLAKSAEQ